MDPEDWTAGLLLMAIEAHMTISRKTDSPSSAEAARAEQIRTLYSQNVGIIFVNALNATIVAAVLWRYANRPLLAGWVVAMLAVTVSRVILRRRYLRLAPAEVETGLWARRFVMAATAAGILWGSGGVLFYDARAPVSHLLLIFVIGGMVAGAAGTMALHLPAFFGFAASAVLPTAARILMEGGGLHLAMGALAAIFGLAMALVACSNHRAVTEALRLRFENQQLIRRLSLAQISLEEVNRTLEQRVAEHGAALER
jgi:hypothetical protein